MQTGPKTDAARADETQLDGCVEDNTPGAVMKARGTRAMTP